MGTMTFLRSCPLSTMIISVLQCMLLLTQNPIQADAIHSTTTIKTTTTAFHSASVHFPRHKPSISSHHSLVARKITTTTTTTPETPTFRVKQLFQSSENNNNQPTSTKGKARFSSSSAPSTNTIDSFLSFISSDIAGITFGLIGLTIALINRLFSIDFDAVDVAADAMGRQSRSDLLAVFAAGAVLLNGISKLDVTSALAETVVLEGIALDNGPLFKQGWGLEKEKEGDLAWALESALSATPAKTAVLLIRNNNDKEPSSSSSEDGNKWIPHALAGVVPSDSTLQWTIPSNIVRSTPVLDKFLSGTKKESYLPTLQALPGKVEFTYLPSNAQEALLLPVELQEEEEEEDGKKAVLVLGSDTAKSFTPRDVAWCQVLASRIGTFL